MRNLGDTVARLKARANPIQPKPGRLTPVTLPGPNPGGLKAFKHVPEALPDKPALVVVLHGCTQTAAAYDLGAGWSALADRHGFIVLYPEQQRTNNPGLCFNWYAPDDTRRDRGEAASIRMLVEATIQDNGVDRSRVFVTGLSAGGAMTSVMLATYPEVFAGGAIFSGLAYGSASSVAEAFDRMRGHGFPSTSASIAAVLSASGHTGPWPSVSIWQGSADYTVSPSNAEALVAQWAGVHKLAPAPDETEQIGAHSRRVWRNASGQPVLEDYRIAGMGHGVPLDTRGAEPCGRAGPYMLDVGLSSSERLVERWALDDGEPARLRGAAKNAPSIPDEVLQTTNPPTDPRSTPRVQRVIEDALRRAGLMP